MSKQTNTLSRRHFLKGAAYTSALSIGGLSSAAFAACGHSSQNKANAVSASSSTVTLFNQSDKTVALDASQPVSLENVNGWIVVKINKASDQSITDLNMNEIITLSAGQRMPFTVNSELSSMLKDSSNAIGDYIVITNEYSALNNMVPVSTYDALVA